MTAYTKNDLRDKILERLTIKDPDEAAQPEDATRASAELQRVIEMMETESLLSFDPNAAANSEVIPAAHFNAYVDMGVYFLGEAFGMPQPLDRYEAGLRALRRRVLPGYDSTPTPIENF